jgi:hypothetical protein
MEPDKVESLKERLQKLEDRMEIYQLVDGFRVDRLSASRLSLSRRHDGGWKIDHRQNHVLDGGTAGPALLARLQEG